MFTLDSFYRSDDWFNFRDILIAERTDKDGFVHCWHCGEPILKKYDLIAHHKIELTEDNVNDMLISLNPENIECVHFKCHNIIHQRFGGFYQSVYLVFGSPCSGKSSWVSKVANADDLILDIDKIWECVSVSNKYNKPNRLKANVFGIRDCIIDQIRCRLGAWRNAYIIGGYPLRTDRDRLCNLLGAKPVFIDTSKDECMMRAKNNEWKEFIEDWFDSYIP